MGEEKSRGETPVGGADETKIDNIEWKKQSQLQRIIRMEKIYDQSCTVLENLFHTIQAYLDMEQELTELDQYYQSSVWLADFDDDRAGKIPNDLKRGILTEDAIYDLLTDQYRLIQMMREIAERDSERDKEAGSK